MRITRKKIAGGVPVFQIDDSTRSVLGGFVLDKSNIALDAVIASGAVMQYDEVKRVAKLIKTVFVFEPSKGQDVKVNKKHLFNVGDSIQGASIINIDKSNADFDIFNLSEAKEVEKDDVLAEVALTSDYVGLNYVDLVVHDGAVEVTVLDRATVYEKRTYGIGSELGAKMPRISRSQSF